MSQSVWCPSVCGSDCLVPWLQIFDGDAGGQTYTLPPRSTEVSHIVRKLCPSITVWGAFDISFKNSTAICHIHPAVLFYVLNYQFQREVAVAETRLLLLWPLLSVTALIGCRVKIFWTPVVCVCVSVCACKLLVWDQSRLSFHVDLQVSAI